MSLKHYIQAARLRTLPLSVSGIITGCGIANFCTYDSDNNLLVQFQTCESNWLIFICCILTTIGFQVLSNFANDYGDGVKGTDTNRDGEKRLVASGDISPKAMKRAMMITTIISLLLAILTLYVAFGTEQIAYFSIFIVLGVASIVAAIKYTVGDNAYGYSGFGDLFVFIFFGLLSTVGSFFLYTKQLDKLIFLPATAVGLLSVAVLNLNNMRDQVEDKINNKNTLVVKIGSKNAKVYHYLLIAFAFMSSVSYVFLDYKSPWQFIFILAFIPLLIHLKKVVETENFSKLDSELKKVALSTFLFALLFAIFG